MPKKKKRIEVLKTTKDLIQIRFLNDVAQQFEIDGVKSFKEGRANEMTYRFDMARSFRNIANWLES